MKSEFASFYKYVEDDFFVIPEFSEIKRSQCLNLV